MKKQCFIFCMTTFLVFSFCDLYGQCSNVRVRRRTRVRTCTPVRINRGTIYAPRRTVRTLDNNGISRKEQLNRDLKREPLGTKRYVLMVQERERIALDEIHKAQKYMLEHPDKRNTAKYRELHYTLMEELDFLSPTITYMKDFPFGNNIADMRPVLVAIRNGKLKYENCAGKSYPRILSAIHDHQRKRLLDFQKNYLRRKF